MKKGISSVERQEQSTPDVTAGTSKRMAVGEMPPLITAIPKGPKEIEVATFDMFYCNIR